MSYPAEYKYSKKIRVVGDEEQLEYYLQVKFLFFWFTAAVYYDYKSADIHARYLATKRGYI
jgi:hypothetical protein